MVYIEHLKFLRTLHIGLARLTITEGSSQIRFKDNYRPMLCYK